MKTFEKWLEDNYGEKLPQGHVPFEWFMARRLPPIVSCTCCYMTISLPNAIVAEDGSIYCPSCAEGCVEGEEG